MDVAVTRGVAVTRDVAVTMDGAVTRGVQMVKDAAVDMAEIRSAWSGPTGVHVSTVADALTRK